MRDILNIQEQDRPISIVHEPETELPFVVLDVHGTKRARFAVQEDAQAYGDAVNFPEPELKQEGMHDSSVGRVQDEHEQQEEDEMPRGIPNKKKAKKAKKAVKKAAAVVKKAAKKVAKRRKRRA